MTFPGLQALAGRPVDRTVKKRRICAAVYSTRPIVDSVRMLLYVRASNTRKARYVMLSHRLLDTLRQYRREADHSSHLLGEKTGT